MTTSLRHTRITTKTYAKFREFFCTQECLADEFYFEISGAFVCGYEVCKSVLRVASGLPRTSIKGFQSDGARTPDDSKALFLRPVEISVGAQHRRGNLTLGHREVRVNQG